MNICRSERRGKTNKNLFFTGNCKTYENGVIEYTQRRHVLNYSETASRKERSKADIKCIESSDDTCSIKTRRTRPTDIRYSDYECFDGHAEIHCIFDCDDLITSPMVEDVSVKRD